MRVTISNLNCLLRRDQTMPMSLPQFDAFGLCLRPFRVGDDAAWLHYLEMPDVRKLTDWQVSSTSELLLLMQSDKQHGPIRFAVAGKDDDQLVGTIGFLDLLEGEAEIAYDLTPSLWGRGIASAACDAVCAWGCAKLGLQRIKACVRVDNRASARVLEKCHFRLEGTTRELRHAGGRLADYWIYRRPATNGQAVNIAADQRA